MWAPTPTSSPAAARTIEWAAAKGRELMLGCAKHGGKHARSIRKRQARERVQQGAPRAFDARSRPAATEAESDPRRCAAADPRAGAGAAPAGATDQGQLGLGGLAGFAAALAGAVGG